MRNGPRQEMRVVGFQRFKSYMQRNDSHSVCVCLNGRLVISLVSKHCAFTLSNDDDNEGELLGCVEVLANEAKVLLRHVGGNCNSRRTKQRDEREERRTEKDIPHTTYTTQV